MELPLADILGGGSSTDPVSSPFRFYQLCVRLSGRVRGPESSLSLFEMGVGTGHGPNHTLSREPRRPDTGSLSDVVFHSFFAPDITPK